MIDSNKISISPLSLNELELIEGTKLNLLDQHQLRLLAHCLACFKKMSQGPLKGPFPIEKHRLEWCLRQPIFKTEQSFISVFLHQLSVAGLQLEKLAVSLGRSPLELTVEDLIDAISDSRLSELSTHSLKIGPMN